MGSEERKLCVHYLLLNIEANALAILLPEDSEFMFNRGKWLRNSDRQKYMFIIITYICSKIVKKEVS